MHLCIYPSIHLIKSWTLIFLGSLLQDSAAVLFHQWCLRGLRPTAVHEGCSYVRKIFVVAVVFWHKCWTDEE